MSLFTYNVNDPHDKISDIRAAALDKPIPEIVASHEYAAALRKHQWDDRRLTSHGSYNGGAEYQLVAHVPGKVASLLDLRHPTWCDSEDELRTTLAQYPECRVHEEGFGK